MKKLITIIGMGAMLCMVPACKKSDIKPQELSTTTADAKQSPQSDPQTQDASLYVMLASKGCSTPQKDYTSVIVDIKSVKVYNAENVWVELPVVSGTWDLVRMQQGDIPGLNITDRKNVKAGAISKVAITFGDNNKLVLNNKPVSCFKLGAQEVIMNIRGEVMAGRVNELLMSINICDNMSTQVNKDGTTCYILKPDMQFQRITQKMIK
ncbi:MAG: DUF4382 domain-containing protein [Bacteroidetes bacterium]|nr:DUF4382 domain-containing protein [Bacteroidota bacterium]